MAEKWPGGQTKTLFWGSPLKSEVVFFGHPLIFQFAATCSALSASRPELKSGTQGYRTDLEVPRFFCRARSGAAFVVLLVVRPLLALVGDSRPNSHVTDANAGSYHDAGARIVYLVRLISIWYCKWFMLFMTRVHDTGHA